MTFRSCPLLRLLRGLLLRTRRVSPLWLLCVPPLASAQSFPETKLLPSGGAAFASFGFAVSSSADGATVLIGAPGEGDAGGAYVFVRTGGGWTEQAALFPSDATEAASFGRAVALSADGLTALVGADRDDVLEGGFREGSAYVFVRDGEVWTQQTKLIASDFASEEGFGRSVAISADGSTALVGSNGENTLFRGAAYVFEREGAAWAEQARLVASDREDFDVLGAYGVGAYVALDGSGTRALVGATAHDVGPSDDDTDTGAAYVFDRGGEGWTEQAILMASDADVQDYFGHVALSADGSTALIGAPGDDDAGPEAGAAYAFTFSDGMWSEQAKFVAADGGLDQQFGTAVSLGADGVSALIGARQDDDNGILSGSAYLFERSASARGGDGWSLRAKLVASDGEPFENYGTAVALGGEVSHAFVGATGDGGSAYVYDLRPPPPPEGAYAYTLGGVSFDGGVAVGVDGDGNAFYTGEFRGTLDFDPGAGTATLTSTQSDVYVASYDVAGALRFAFRIGNALATSEAAGGLAVDPAGYFVVTGSQPFGAIDFDPDPAGQALRTGRLFVAGYDADGGFRFAVTPEGGAGSAGAGRGVAVDAEGNAYVAGLFQGALNFAPGASEPRVLTSAGGTDAFVASYTAEGVLRFAYSFGALLDDAGSGVAADGAGNVYLTGRSTPVLAASGEGEPRSGGLSARAFLAGYTPAGLRYGYVFGPGVGEAVALDAAGNVYVAGSFIGAAEFDPNDADGDGDYEEAIETAGGSAFLASYTPEGFFRFVVVPEGPTAARGLTTLPSGVSFVTGTFGDAVDFDPGVPVAPLAAGDGTDAFVASYDETGAFRSAFGFGGDGLNVGRGIATDGTQNTLFLTGAFSGTTDFDLGDGVDERTSAGQDDLFMLQLRPESSPVAAEEPLAAPATVLLSAAYPNPFREHARFTVALDRTAFARVSVYDVLGREVRVLHEGVLEAGAPHVLTLPGEGLASGVYVVRVVTPSGAGSRRVTVQR